MDNIINLINDTKIKQNFLADCASSFMRYLMKQGTPVAVYFVNDDYYELYIFDKESKVWSLYDDLYLKRSFIKALKNAAKNSPVKRKYDLCFSNGDLDDICELVKVYTDDIDFETSYHDDNGNLIININGDLFNVDTKEFIPWENKFAKMYPFRYSFESERTKEEIINIFKKNKISSSLIDIFINNYNIEADSEDGYNVIDLDNIICNYENGLDSPDNDEDEYIDFGEY